MRKRIMCEFSIGDVVMLMDDPSKGYLIFLDSMAVWKGRKMTISKLYQLSNGKVRCSVLENTFFWDTRGFKLVKKAKKQKFKVGDWVIFKEEVDPTESLLMRSESRNIWKKKFMKIHHISSNNFSQVFYSVHENTFIWPEEWLEKVE